MGLCPVCARLLSLITLRQGHHTELPNSSRSCFVMLSLWIRATANGNGVIGRVYSNFWSVHCPLAVCHSTNHSNQAADGPYPTCSCDSSLLISRTLNTPSAVPVKRVAQELLMPNQIQNLYVGFILFIGPPRFALPTPPHQTGQPPVTVSCHAVSQNGVLPSRPFTGQDATCMFHQTRQDGRLVSEFFSCAALNMAFDGSDVSTQHH